MLSGLGIDSMRCSLRPPNERHAVLPTSLARDSDWPSEPVEILGDGFNTPVAQWALHTRGRNWLEGRIAECPRLQQKSSEPLDRRPAVIVNYLSPLRRGNATASPVAVWRVGAPRDPPACGGPSSGRDPRCWHAAAVNRVVHSCPTTSRPQRDEDLAEKQANPPLFFSARLA